MSGNENRDRFDVIRRLDEKGDRVAKLYVAIINLGEQLMQAHRSNDDAPDDDAAADSPVLDNLTERFEIVIDGILGKKDNLLKIKEKLDSIEKSQIERAERKRRARKRGI